MSPRISRAGRMHLPALVSVILLPAVMVLCALFEVEQTGLITLLTAVVALIPFFMAFEKRKLKTRDLLPIVVMSALAAAGRIIFAPFPGFKPMAAIIIVTALVFGPESGFMTGALSALASNLFFGQGPWTPWQMYCFGLIGFGAGLLQGRGLLRRPFFVYAYGFIATLLYGFIMDSWHVLSFIRPLTWPGALVAYANGFFFNLSHAVATVVFLLPIRAPWTRQLERIRRKFGLIAP